MHSAAGLNSANPVIDKINELLAQSSVSTEDLQALTAQISLLNSIEQIEAVEDVLKIDVGGGALQQKLPKPGGGDDDFFLSLFVALSNKRRALEARQQWSLSGGVGHVVDQVNSCSEVGGVRAFSSSMRKYVGRIEAKKRRGEIVTEDEQAGIDCAFKGIEACNRRIKALEIIGEIRSPNVDVLVGALPKIIAFVKCRAEADQVESIRSAATREQGVENLKTNSDEGLVGAFEQIKLVCKFRAELLPIFGLINGGGVHSLAQIKGFLEDEAVSLEQVAEVLEYVNNLYQLLPAAASKNLRDERAREIRDFYRKVRSFGNKRISESQSIVGVSEAQEVQESKMADINRVDSRVDGYGESKFDDVSALRLSKKTDQGSVDAGEFKSIVARLGSVLRLNNELFESVGRFISVAENASDITQIRVLLRVSINSRPEYESDAVQKRALIKQCNERVNKLNSLALGSGSSFKASAKSKSGEQSIAVASPIHVGEGEQRSELENVLSEISGGFLPAYGNEENFPGEATDTWRDSEVDAGGKDEELLSAIDLTEEQYRKVASFINGATDNDLGEIVAKLRNGLFVEDGKLKFCDQPIRLVCLYVSCVIRSGWNSR